MSSKAEEEFKPHPNMVQLYRIYLGLAVLPLVVAGLLVTWGVSVVEPSLAYIPAAVFFVPVVVAVCFVLYWSSRYFESIAYRLTQDEVVVDRGVWWKVRSTVPYSRVMAVETLQGPISRRLGIATLDVYTAGYTGVSGGSGGPRARRAEASFIHIPNFVDLRERVLSIVRGRPLFGAAGSEIGAEMLSELRRMRELLEKTKPG